MARRSSRWGRVLLAGPALLALTLAACTGGGGSSSSPSAAPAAVTGKPITGGTVTFALPPATTANWIFPMTSLAYFSVYNISYLQQPMYRPLYWFGGHNDQPTVDYGLSVAQPPSYSSNGRTVTIKLKPWKWSNGESLNADDVLFWMNMVKAERANWAAYVPGEFPDNVTEVTKVNDNTVRLSLNATYSSNWYTYNELSQITPMPEAWDVTSVGAKPGSGGCTTDMSKCAAVYKFLVSQSKDQNSYATSKIWGVVDGPWRLGSYSSSGNFALVPNKSYSGSPKPKLDQVKFLPFTSDAAEFNVLKAGGTIDLGYVPAQDLPPKPAGSAVPSSNPVGSGYYLAPEYLWAVNYFPINFNNPTMGPVFKQLYVRQALQMTLNQPLDVSKAWKGYAYPQYGPVPVKPPNKWLSPKAQQGNPYPFSISKATSLLTSHGWTEQSGVMTCTKPGAGSGQCGAGIGKGTKLSINYDYSSGTQALDQILQQYKSDAAKAGIQLNLKQKPFDSVIGESVPCKPSQATCSWQVANWGGGWIYAPDFLPTGESLFAPGAVANYGSFNDPQATAIINQTIDGSADQEKQALASYAKYMEQHVPVVFGPTSIGSYQGDAGTMIAKNLGGYAANAYGYMTPEAWYFTK